MPLCHFHPVTAGWFEARFAAPTPAQSRGWRAIRSARHTLIAAPTGSGKTLAAFLAAIDDLLREGLEHTLPDQVRVVYVSPLKALSSDIHSNLAEPRRQISRLAEESGLPPVRMTAAVRTGDTPHAERAAMLKTPPHILVTTPESLYLLLTAKKSREMLRSARAVIVDEIHAVLEARRGAHLALTLERLEHVVRGPLQRIGLSATQKPIELVADFLAGSGPSPLVVDEGHARELDLGLELTGSPLETVMSGEAWDEVYDRLAGLIRAHRTTLVFVNSRRLAERATRHLAERLGEGSVAAHHGSLSKESRLSAEERLKGGKLQALVATASLELGIDVGQVDLVCQLGSPRRVSAFLQRVGRSGHTVSGTPKGRLFPLTRDELVECAALLRLVRRGELDRVVVPAKPLDVLAQQVVAEAACEDWSEDALFDLVRRAYPYRALGRGEFDGVVEMVSRGFSTRRGRRGALVHRDAVNRRLRGRKGARLAAITSGGAIPDNADYRVVLEPEGTFIGTLNEDFAIESMAGDIFQLGNSSWRVLRIETGTVRVADARGAPPNIPFWLGEAPARSDELSRAVSELRAEVEERLEEDPARWLATEAGLPHTAAQQIASYLAESKRLLGAIPTQNTLVLERFFDDSGGMQLVLHSPFGARVNRAWGLALRKKFCRTFNFELQAAASEEGVLLSLGPQHSFPLEEVFRYLHPDTVRDTLVQAVLDAPLFQTHWRWCATISLAVARSRGGKKTPPQIQRMQAEDLLAAAFPDAAACLENIAGDREVPDHPLVRQTLADCLEEAMDLPHLEELLRAVHAGELTLVARDTPEPSPLAHGLLNARVYEFLDDAPLEERRAQAVYTRRALEPSAANDLGALDSAAIERVRGEVRPAAGSPDELHDALMTCGFLAETGTGPEWREYFVQLAAAGRAARVTPEGATTLWVAAERLVELLALFPDAVVDPAIQPPAGFDTAADPDHAIRELLRGRLEVAGPTTAAALAAAIGVGGADAESALLALETEGVVLRGFFTPGVSEREWCDRRLLARIHRYTLDRLRAEIEPASAADFTRFLFRWQRLEPGSQVAGLEGLAGVVRQLDGFELAAAGWERDVLPARCREYQPELLDTLCLSGRVAWGRRSPTRQNGGGARAAGPLRSSPVALFLRQSAPAWLSPEANGAPLELATEARQLVDALERRGASFFHELVAESGLIPTQAERALGELAALGLVSSDSFSGLRALLTPPHKRRSLSGQKIKRRGRTTPDGVDTAGRWSLIRHPGASGPELAAIEQWAWTLLRRYGVVFRKLLAREQGAPAWRELALFYRRLEARGELRGGRFVTGFSGEQFALPEAVGQLRTVRRERPDGRLTALSAADPLNLTGIVTPGERIPALAGNRIVYRDGVPLAARVAGEVMALAAYDPGLESSIRRSLESRASVPALRAYLGPGRPKQRAQPVSR
ncbi:MAG: DEAD/DEAH box helicase [Longimicrobiaceae bacterium]